MLLDVEVGKKGLIACSLFERISHLVCHVLWVHFGVVSTVA